MLKPHFRLKLLGATVLSTALVTTGLLVSVAPSGAAPDPGPASGSTPPEFVAQGGGSSVDPTSILAYRKTNVTPAQVAQRFSSVDSQTVRVRGAITLDDNTSSSRLVTVTVPDGSAPAVMQSMNASGLYDGVQLNGFAIAQYTNTPNDPSFGASSSYGLKGGAGGSNFDKVWADLASAAPSANVPVAVLDSGFDLNHQDFVGANIKAGWNVADNSPDVSPCNGDPHGTETSGVVGAKTNNAYGIVGAGFDPTVMVYRISSRNCRGADWPEIINGINRAVQDHAKIINISLATDRPIDYPTVLCRAITDATKAGTIVIASAGNEGTGLPMYPAACPDALSVAATDSSGALTDFTNRSSTVDIAAAGVDVPVLAPNNVITVARGTSFSAPYVAAAASLLMRLVPGATPIQIRAALVENGNPVTGVGPVGYKVMDVKKAYDALLKPTPSLLVKPRSVTFTSTGGSATMAVNSTGNWTAKSDQTWLTVSPPSSLSGNTTVTLAADPNTATSARTAQVTFTGPNNISTVVTVAQAGQTDTPRITLSNLNGQVGSAGGSTTITVNSTWNWTATSGGWATITPSSGGPGTTEVTVTAQPNTTEAWMREAKIYFFIVGGTANSSYTLKQSANLLVSSITASLAGAANSSTNITVEAGGSWTASSNQSWLKVSPASGGAGSSTVALTATANTTNSQRSAVVTFIGPNNSRDSVVVTQATQPVSVSSSLVSLTSAADSTRVTVSSPTAWTAASDHPWLSVSPATGASGSRTVTFTATANPTTESRRGVVTFTTPAGTTSVTVIQAGIPLEVSTPTVTLADGALGSSATVTVTATGAWTAKSNQSWLTISPPSGVAGSSMVAFSAPANTTSLTRTATVTFSGPNSSRATVKVTQVAQPVSVSTWVVSLTSAANSSRVTVTSPGTWTATSDQPWLTLSPTSGTSGSRTVTFAAATNPTTVTRSAFVTFTAPGGTATVWVLQAGAPLAVSQPTVLLSGAVGATGWETVSATGTWTAKSNQSWLSLTPASGGTGDTSVALVTTAANLTNSSRSATVTFTGPNSSKVTVAVTQTPAGR